MHAALHPARTAVRGVRLARGPHRAVAAGGAINHVASARRHHWTTTFSLQAFTQTLGLDLALGDDHLPV